MNVYVFATLKLHPQRQDGVIACLQELARHCRQETGCLDYNVFSATNDALTIHIFEKYQDSDAVAFHRETPHYKQYREFIADKLAAPIAVNVMTPVAV